MKQHILFVDDDPAVLDGLQRGLRTEEAHWQMDFAESGAEALEMIQDTTYDAIVTDVMMPRMNGLTLLEELRKKEKTKDIPVLILTGGDRGHLGKRAAKQGAVAILHKPVTSQNLVAALRRVLAMDPEADRQEGNTDQGS